MATRVEKGARGRGAAAVGAGTGAGAAGTDADFAADAKNVQLRAAVCAGSEAAGAGGAPVRNRVFTRRACVRGALGALGALAGAGAVLALGACANGDEDVSAEPAAVNPTEGKLGGKLVVYTSCSESLVNVAVPAYMAEHAVAVTVVRGASAQLIDAVVEEAASGAPVADVVWGGDPSLFSLAQGRVEGGAFETYVSGENSAMRDDCRNSDGFATPVSLDVPVIALSAAVAEGAEAGETDGEAAGASGSGEEDAGGAAGTTGEDASAGTGASAAAAADGASRVRTYSDLLASDVLARVAVEDPAASQAGLLAIAALVEDAEDSASARNEAWRLAARVHAGARAAAEDEVGDGEAALHALAYGDADVALGLEQACAADRDSAAAFYYPLQRVWAVPQCAAVVRGAANLEQAYAWIDYVTSWDCQQAMAREAMARSVRADVDTPEGLPDFVEPEDAEAERGADQGADQGAEPEDVTASSAAAGEDAGTEAGSGAGSGAGGDTGDTDALVEGTVSAVEAAGTEADASADTAATDAATVAAGEATAADASDGDTASVVDDGAESEADANASSESATDNAATTTGSVASNNAAGTAAKPVGTIDREGLLATWAKVLDGTWEPEEEGDADEGASADEDPAEAAETADPAATAEE